jgi:hypothetical protein
LHFRIVFAGIFCLQTSGLILQNKSHPDSNKSHPGYHQATGLAARPYSFMGNIPLHATGRRKIGTTLQRVDGTLLCALIHPGPMLQSPPCGSVLSGRQHPADCFHQREHHQYDNNDIGLYIRLLHDVSGDKNDRMFRAIKLNKYKFSDIQIIERLSVLQKVLSVLQKEICNALQISPRNTRNLQYTANFPKKFRIFAAHFIFSNQDRMQKE